MTLHPQETWKAMQNVLIERENQDLIWGEQNHSLPLWLAILDEEVGEFAKTILGKTFDGKSIENCKEEAIQIAAVAVAIIEFIDRWNGRSPAL